MRSEKEIRKKVVEVAGRAYAALRENRDKDAERWLGVIAALEWVLDEREEI